MQAKQTQTEKNKDVYYSNNQWWIHPVGMGVSKYEEEEEEETRCKTRTQHLPALLLNNNNKKRGNDDLNKKFKNENHAPSWCLPEEISKFSRQRRSKEKMKCLAPLCSLASQVVSASPSTGSVEMEKKTWSERKRRGGRKIIHS